VRLDERDGVRLRFGVVIELTAHAKVQRALQIN
jgi:hypothetical protein